VSCLQPEVSDDHDFCFWTSSRIRVCWKLQKLASM